MDKISVRYGESFNLELVANDVTAETATFYAGKVGQTPVITIPTSFVEGVAYIVAAPDDTKVPLAKYKYQITVTYSGGEVYKFPTKDDCDESGLPELEVLEALDETEVI